MSEDIKERLLNESYKGQEAMRREALSLICALEAKLASKAEECAKIAESHTGACSAAARSGESCACYDEACRDIAKAIRGED